MALEVFHDPLFDEKSPFGLLVLDIYFLPLVLTSYVLFIAWIGPSYMKPRHPFNTQKLLVVYNFIQVFFNIYITYAGACYIIECVNLGVWCLLKKEFLSNSSVVRQGHFLLKLVYLNKLLDLMDTIFIVLRKKRNQITFLHVVHHIVVCILVRWGLASPHATAGTYACIALDINAFVHSIMYFYYGLSSLGPSMQPYLWWKKYLTLLQIAQFIVVLFYMLVGFISGCEELGGIEVAAFLFTILLLILFFKFYANYKKDLKRSV